MDVHRLFDALVHLQESASWRSVFGEPQVQGEVTVIPLACIGYAFGLGFGSAEVPVGEEAKRPGGQGGGMGGYLSARPVGVVKIAGGEVKIEPYVDVGRVALAGIFMVAWNIFWISRTIRRVARLCAEQRGEAGRISAG